MAIRKYIIAPIAMLEESGRMGGILLVAATILSLTFANSESGDTYLKLWNQEIGFSFLQKSILHWINDALMPLFFLLVGLEIKRELTQGELSGVRQAMLPVAAAVGGIVVPALIYFALNVSEPGTLRGWAIPTATDIAFSLGLLSLLGSRVPFQLKVFLTALAIIDDLGAILIIAIFYTASLQTDMLLYAGLTFAGIAILSRFRIQHGWVYMVLGVILWYFVLKSGVHATIAGVLIAAIIPRELDEGLEHQLARPVTYVILPLFALANTAIPLSVSMAGQIFSPLSMGIIAGLVIGKPLGILGASWAVARLKLADWPEGISVRQVLGIGMTAGIGFTMSIFISSLAFPDGEDLNLAKLAIIAASLLAGIGGTLMLMGKKIREFPEEDRVSGNGSDKA